MNQDWAFKPPLGSASQRGLPNHSQVAQQLDQSEKGQVTQHLPSNLAEPSPALLPKSYDIVTMRLACAMQVVGVGLAGWQTQASGQRGNVCHMKLTRKPRDQDSEVEFQLAPAFFGTTSLDPISGKSAEPHIGVYADMKTGISCGFQRGHVLKSDACA
ncbi:hypothetical protein CFIMG_007641RA00001 [Ceratocystis fimbriata CBS 114723]|uniref:Uncharacterized protein n=1 Tax=Ceratocystis fimbriata CBS 114723 TaxID=1035309 RepID=A0A2C5XCQ7_9PEZI|nr:hypothetical protein CFIMG_007641RA00001 [Ceratocystis fimbriata CBS 114723]